MATHDYKEYRNLESYLRQTVNVDFHSNGFIGASDFFCIIIWKANRAKSKIAKKLLKVDPNLELCCKNLTNQIFKSKSNKEKLKILIQDYKFRLPMSSAILSIFYPDDFSVYDIRVCETLKNFESLVSTTSFENLWVEYCKYVESIKENTPEGLNLVEKDHLLWGTSFYNQLEKDILTGFKSSI